MLDSQDRKLPIGWAESTLDDVSVIVLGQSPPSSFYNAKGQGLPFFQGKSEFGTIYPIPKKWCSAPKKIAEKGDVLISVRAPVGPTNICPFKACIGRGLAAIRGLGGTSSFYILYALRAIEKDIERKGTGTTFKAITGNQLRSIPILLPPLTEQHRIVAKIEELLSDLDAGVETLREVQIQLKSYRQSVLKSAFEGRLTKAWREQHEDELEPVSALLERIKDERKQRAKIEGLKHKTLKLLDTFELPVLPKDWKWVVLKDISSQISDGSHNPPPKQSSGIPMLSARNILDGKIEFSTYRFISDKDFKEESKRIAIVPNDVLLTIVGTIGRSAVVQRDTPVFSVQRSVAVIKPISIKPNYLSFFFRSPTSIRFLLRSAKGTAQKGVYLNQLKLMPVPIPTLEEQHLIVQEIEYNFSVADKIEESINQSLGQMQRLRKSILQKAFEGKLVPQDPKDEPAEKLLERIRAERAKLEANKSKKKRTI